MFAVGVKIDVHTFNDSCTLLFDQVHSRNSAIFTGVAEQVKLIKTGPFVILVFYPDPLQEYRSICPVRYRYALLVNQVVIVTE